MVYWGLRRLVELSGQRHEDGDEMQEPKGGVAAARVILDP